MIVLLVWHQGSAAIGNRVVPLICLLLWQHCPQSIFGHISLQQEWFGVVSKHQYGSCHASLFQCFKSFHGILGEQHPLWLPAGRFPCKVLAKGLSNACKSFNELPVVAHQTEKSSHLCMGLWQGVFCDSFQVKVAWVDPVLWDSMY